MKTSENRNFIWKRKETTGRKGELYNKEVHNFSACQNYYDATIKVIEVGWACSRHEKETLEGFVRKT
jgi:hypothetical protein